MSDFGRQKRVRVKTAKGRKLSSTRWLERQLNDPFVIEARERGYRSRAAFKLIEINEKFSLIKPGQVIVDLGAAPGGWSQVASEIVKPSEKKGQVLAIDLLEMGEIPGVEILKGDFTEQKIVEEFSSRLKGKPDIIMSDMAASSTGLPDIDHDRIIMLCEEVFKFAFQNLKTGGSVVVKVLRGGTESDLLKRVKQRFETVKHFKPKSSRADSAEIYLVAKGYKG
ncbi:MAG: RlmE family RNA methyltransferase [Sphingobacteriia bacterium]|nr:RlmE family RNA methyltransferase [Sphingobacteriia bacterium]